MKIPLRPFFDGQRQSRSVFLPATMLFSSSDVVIPFFPFFFFSEVILKVSPRASFFRFRSGRRTLRRPSHFPPFLSSSANTPLLRIKRWCFTSKKSHLIPPLYGRKLPFFPHGDNRLFPSEVLPLDRVSPTLPDPFCSFIKRLLALT